jgi:phosphate transport system substrate-binding protein
MDVINWEKIIMKSRLRKFYILTIVAAFSFFGIFTSSCTEAAEQVVVGTGVTAAYNIFFRIQDPMQKANDVKLVILARGPIQSLKDLDTGMVQAAVGGVSFGDWMTMMENDGYAVKNKQAYQPQVIGKDIIQVITNKDVPVSSLTKGQLAGIFSGRTKNWLEIGGPDRTITVFTSAKSPGTQFVFQKEILDGTAYAPEIINLTTDGELKTRVRSTPGAIALATQGQIDESVNVPSIPVIERPITLITRGNPSQQLDKVLSFIKGAGQQYIVK